MTSTPLNLFWQCQQCKDYFLWPTNPIKEHCSDLCVRLAEDRISRCELCAGPMDSRVGQSYCSAACRQKAYRLRKKEGTVK